MKVWEGACHLLHSRKPTTQLVTVNRHRAQALRAGAILAARPPVSDQAGQPAGAASAGTSRAAAASPPIPGALISSSSESKQPALPAGLTQALGLVPPSAEPRQVVTRLRQSARPAGAPEHGIDAVHDSIAAVSALVSSSAVAAVGPSVDTDAPSVVSAPSASAASTASVSSAPVGAAAAQSSSIPEPAVATAATADTSAVMCSANSDAELVQYVNRYRDSVFMQLFEQLYPLQERLLRYCLLACALSASDVRCSIASVACEFCIWC